MFVGKPESVIFCDLSESVSSEKTFIDIQKLIDNTSAILKNGMETPVSGRNQLQKLANGFGGFTSQVSVKFLKTMSKDETADCWEYYITTTARWLTFFDEFRLLPDELQVSDLRWKITVKKPFKKWISAQNSSSCVACVGSVREARHYCIASEAKSVLWSTYGSGWKECID